MRELSDKGNYTVKDTNQVITYDFTFPVFDDSDGCDNKDILALANRQAKVDANNTTRVSVRSENGHSDRKVMSPEEKAEAKEQRAKVKAVGSAIKGLSDAEINDLPESVREALGY